LAGDFFICTVALLYSSRIM